MDETDERRKEGFLLQLDMFRFTPTKFLEQTITGALISFLALALIGFLAFHELDLVLNNSHESEILFENLHIQDLQVNIDIELLDLPCDVVDLRFVSQRNRPNRLDRIRIMKEAKPTEPASIPFSGSRPFQELLEVAKAKKESCVVRGHFYIHLMSNRFYVGFGNTMLLNRLRQQLGSEFKLSLRHKIHDLTFGPESARWADLSEEYGLKGFHTLKGHVGEEDRKDGYDAPFLHTYTVVAVPNVFDRVFGDLLELFQYTSSAYQRRSTQQAGIIFM